MTENTDVPNSTEDSRREHINLEEIRQRVGQQGRSSKSETREENLGRKSKAQGRGENKTTDPKPTRSDRRKLSRKEATHLQWIIDALSGNPADRECVYRAERIRNCSPTTPCGEGWCPHCRREIQITERQRVVGSFMAAPMDQLRFLTLLIGLSDTPTRELPGMKAKAAQDLHNALKKFSGIRAYGLYEIDAKDPQRVAMKGANTKKALGALGMPIGRGSDQYLLHLHAVVDLGDHEGDQVASEIRKKFEGPYRLELKNLWSTRTTAHNLTTIADYMAKHRLQYADNIHGSENGKPTRYQELYPYHAIREVITGTSSLTRKTSSGQINGKKYRFVPRFNHGI